MVRNFYLVNFHESVRLIRIFQVHIMFVLIKILLLCFPLSSFVILFFNIYKYLFLLEFVFMKQY